jgi:hypothetical protein
MHIITAIAQSKSGHVTGIIAEGMSYPEELCSLTAFSCSEELTKNSPQFSQPFGIDIHDGRWLR